MVSGLGSQQAERPWTQTISAAAIQKPCECGDLPAPQALEQWN